MPDKLNDDLRQLFQSKEVNDFLVAANSFIGLLENNNLEEEDFYRETHLALLSLYTTGMYLPEVELKYSGNDDFYDHTKLFQNQNQVDISHKLGKHSIYYKVFNPIHPEKDEPIQGWLVDDYADIYRDIKIELEKIKIGTNEAVEDALWQLKFSLEHHWGNHCIDALRALHYLKYDSYGF